MNQPVTLINGWRATILSNRFRLFIVLQIYKALGNPFAAYGEMRKLILLRKTVDGFSIRKYIKSGNRYFHNADYCGYPSDSYKSLIQYEFMPSTRKDTKNGTNLPVLQTLIWGITNRCPLSCQHCYEWDNIRHSDSLNLAALEKILDIFNENGIRHIQFSGGEPLSRFDDLEILVKKASLTMDCWLLTSGYGLSQEKASALKRAGLTGANISLDHWDEQKHNSFRNNDKSFLMVAEAVRNCIKEGIIVSLSLCATRDFVTEDNLFRYLYLAREWGAHFIRILEPRAVGKFSNQKVHLQKHQMDLLSDFTLRMNSDSQYKDYPIVTYYGYHQRKLGCFGAGNRYIYVDPDGYIHACPFCRGKIDNILQAPFLRSIQKVKNNGCHAFASV